LGERPADESGSDVGIEDGFELPPYESLGMSALVRLPPPRSCRRPPR
jgi:hypothetical protein